VSARRETLRPSANEGTFVTGDPWNVLLTFTPPSNTVWRFNATILAQDPGAPAKAVALEHIVTVKNDGGTLTQIGSTVSVTSHHSGQVGWAPSAQWTITGTSISLEVRHTASSTGEGTGYDGSVRFKARVRVTGF
jgi:hypothetical protein